ncbi:DUF4328 domain-containing protein [Nannocystaceae bacterium ST9]
MKSFVLACVLGFALLVAFFGLQMSIAEIEVHHAAARGRPPTPDEEFYLPIAWGLLMWLSAIVTALCALMWWAWSFQAAINLRALGARSLEYTPAALVWWWFVPIFAFVRPYQAIAELCRASAAAAEGQIDRWPQFAVSKLLAPWWASWLAYFVSAPVMWVAAYNKLVPIGAWVGAFSYAAAMLAAISALGVVFIIDRAQKRASGHA